MGREEGSAAPAQVAVPAPSLSTKEAGEALKEFFWGSSSPASWDSPCAGLQLLGYSWPVPWGPPDHSLGVPEAPPGAAFPSSAPFHLMAIVSNLYGVCLVCKCIYFCMFAIFS